MVGIMGIGVVIEVYQVMVGIIIEDGMGAIGMAIIGIGLFGAVKISPAILIAK